MVPSGITEMLIKNKQTNKKLFVILGNYLLNLFPLILTENLLPQSPNIHWISIDFSVGGFRKEMGLELSHGVVEFIEMQSFEAKETMWIP